MDRIITTTIGVIVAIAGSAGLFIGANKLFDLAPTRWRVFTASIAGALGFAMSAILWGNNLVRSGELFILIATVVLAGAGYLLAGLESDRNRLALGIGTGGGLGVILGLMLRSNIASEGGPTGALPSIDFVMAALWTAIGLVIGWVTYRFAGKASTLPSRLAFWGTIGWLIGAWLGADIGAGTRAEAILASAVVGAGFGAWAGFKPNPDKRKRDRVSEKSRTYIFLAPALFFIFMALAGPTVITIFLSFKDRRGQETVGFKNYSDVFTDNTIFNVEGWRNIFTSSLFYWGAALVIVGLIAARYLGRQIGTRLGAGGMSVAPAAIGIFLLTFAVFSALRGTVFNNLWWVFTVTVAATALGLAIAVLADRAKYESLAKSLIFMPMAISFVGAGIIWRFMYIPRPPSKDQTGVLNSLWVALGKLSNDSSGTAIALLVLGLAGVALAFLAYRGWKAGETGILYGALFTLLPILWLAYRFIGPGLGGFTITDSGEIETATVIFTQEAPFNNVWLMVVLIWIQTGFTMVIFSAAIKAVPAELIEASKVDGATENQTFWRVIIPQIAPTIGVVVTTLIVLVMKVFDIVKVMTNGNFDTQVIANEMWQRAFTELNFGLGSALAVVLFIAVLPVMYINIRRMQKAA